METRIMTTQDKINFVFEILVKSKKEGGNQWFYRGMRAGEGNKIFVQFTPDELYVEAYDVFTCLDWNECDEIWEKVMDKIREVEPKVYAFESWDNGGIQVSGFYEGWEAERFIESHESSGTYAYLHVYNNKEEAEMTYLELRD
jgi:hypothetical protein